MFLQHTLSAPMKLKYNRISRNNTHNLFSFKEIYNPQFKHPKLTKLGPLQKHSVDKDYPINENIFSIDLKGVQS